MNKLRSPKPATRLDIVTEFYPFHIPGQQIVNERCICSYVTVGYNCETMHA
jgi:hypothetical protein